MRGTSPSDMAKVITKSLNYSNLTEQDLLANNGEIVSWAIDKGTFHELPKAAITAKVLLQKAIRGPQKGCSLLQIIALVNTNTTPSKVPPLKHIPKEVFTHELLSTKEDSGETVYHMLAHSHVLGCIPKELITKDSLLLTTDEGRTVLHSVAINNPELIPKEITLKEMLMKDKNNFTPLHGYACSNKWADIPKIFLTKESVEIKDREGNTPTDYMLEEFGFDAAYRDKKSDPKRISQIKHILSLISPDFLKTLVKRKGIENLDLLKLIKQEELKRNLHSKLSEKEQSIEI
jgi:hypothetical protein